jgi:Flp pilus assembly protein CpaB
MRASRATVVGIVVFAVGTAATFLLLRRDSGSTVTVGRGQAGVLVAVNQIPAGTTGADAVARGLVAARAVRDRDRPAAALTDIAQLARTTAIAAIPARRVLTSADFPPSQTRVGTIRMPPGTTALAVQMTSVPGVAGFAGAGDKIDIYAVAKQATAPGARLVMQGIEVLSVNGAALVPSPGVPGGPGLVFLLAVTPAQAERLVYLTSFEAVYFSLVPKDQAAIPPPPGSTPADAFKPL